MSKIDFFKFASCVFLAGTAWVFLPSQIQHVGVEFAVGYRILIGGIVLGVFAFLKKEKFPIFNMRTFLGILGYGFFLYGFNYILCYSSAKYIPSGLVSLVVSAMIIPNTIFGYMVLKKKTTTKGIVGAVISLLGLAVVFLTELSQLDLSNVMMKGFLLAFASIFLSAFGTVIGGKIIKELGTIYWPTSIAMLVGSFIDILYGYIQHKGFVFSNDIYFIFSLIYLSIFITAFVMIVYMQIVSKFGPEKASYIWILVPIIALNMSAVFENMKWSINIILGTVIVMIGSFISLNKKFTLKKLRKKNEKHTEKSIP